MKNLLIPLVSMSLDESLSSLLRCNFEHYSTKMKIFTNLSEMMING